MGQRRPSRLARTLGTVIGSAAGLALAACSAGHPAPASIAAPTTVSPAATQTASPTAAGTSRAAPAASVTITAVGDMMLGSTPDLPPDPGTYFRAVKPALPGQITRLRVAGITVAFVAFAPYPYTASLLDRTAARALITRAAQQAQLVVVYMHAGAEGSDADHVTGRDEPYLGEDRGNPEVFAHMAIDAGASLVVASGPHVLRGLQFYKDHLIAYSLGNFAGYGNFSIHGDLAMSAILRVRLSSSGRLEQARLYPTQFSGQGRPVPGGGAIAFTARLSAEDFGASAARIRPSGVIQAP